MERRDKINYYLDIAEAVLERGTCLRRNFGAVIVNRDEIISTGYTGAPRGRKNCCEIGGCTRERLKIPKGQRYELCRSVHAEANAIISAPRSQMIGAQLYLACHDAVTGELYGDIQPCAMCKRLILNAGIERIYVRNTRDCFTEIITSEWIIFDDTLEIAEGY
ncbi:MAG: cytidine deaminase [Oscillospiraceae bacterium]|nr:cytidine deaminase [Oscillospiraceae bacterium]